MPAESSHPKLSPQPRRNAIRMHNDGWMNSAWNNFELNPTYMQEVGTFELLNADEEVRYAKEYSEARAKIHGLLAQFPQVIMAELDFLKNLPPGQLLSFIELDPCNDDLVYSDDALEKLIAQAIETLLDKRKEILRQFARFQPSKSRNATEHAVQVTGEWLPQIFNPIVKEFGKLSFQPRFYSACVEFFIRGDWEATGLDEAQRHALSTQMEEIHQRAIEAMNNLVEGNLRLVISIARHFVCTLMPLSDLVQEGNIGLMRAVESARTSFLHLRFLLDSPIHYPCSECKRTLHPHPRQYCASTLQDSPHGAGIPPRARTPAFNRGTCKPRGTLGATHPCTAENGTAAALLASHRHRRPRLE